MSETTPARTGDGQTTAAPAADGTNSPPLAPTGPRLLVVDDDTVHRMVICRIAARAGYDAVAAGSREEAAKLLAMGGFAVITVDLSLGKDTGLDVLADIAAANSGADVVIISGSNETVRESAATTANSLDINVVTTLQKPVDLARLRECLQVSLSRVAAGLVQPGRAVAV